MAQKQLYLKYAATMRGVCMRYCKNTEDAKDVLQDGFAKVFTHIHTYAGTGSLEGWIKRIMINTAIKQYHKNKNILAGSMEEDLEVADSYQENSDALPLNAIYEADLSQAEILASLQTLPDSYRIVFNMFCLENYSHKEIGEILGMDENTSRARLFRCRKKLQEYLFKASQQKLKDTERARHGR